MAMGMSATMVPTLVPTESEIKHDARNSPTSSTLPGSADNVRFTVASTHPMPLADAAKAPASTKIHSISIRFDVPAPRL